MPSNVTELEPEGAMMVRGITSSAIRQLESEIEKDEAQAKRELKKRKTRAVGLIRADLLQECRQRLTFIKYMLRDAKGRSIRRRKPESPSANCGRSEGRKVGLPFPANGNPVRRTLG